MFEATQKYLDDLKNPPVIPKSVSIRLGWTHKMEHREFPMYAWFVNFEHGEFQMTRHPELAAPMTEELAKKIMYRALQKYPKSSIEESASPSDAKTELQQLGFTESLEAVREAVRNAVADGFNHLEIINAAREVLS
jgi:hypothetical protein